MTRETPIACSLTTDELPARLAEIRAIGADALLHVDSGGTLHFRNDAGTRARLEEIVAAESECCGFLVFSLLADDDELELRITAPEGAEPVADELVHAFGGASRA